MVWFTIGPGGFKTILLKLDCRLYSLKCINLIQNKGIIQEIKNKFRRNYIWQQDYYY